MKGCQTLTTSSLELAGIFQAETNLIGKCQILEQGIFSMHVFLLHKFNGPQFEQSSSRAVGNLRTFGSRARTSSCSCLWAASLLGQSFCWDTQGKWQYLKFLSGAYLIVLTFTASHHLKAVGRLGKLLSFAKFCTLVCKHKSHQGPLLLGRFLGTPLKFYYSSLHVMTPHQSNACGCLISGPTPMKQRVDMHHPISDQVNSVVSLPSLFIVLQTILSANPLHLI